VPLKQRKCVKSAIRKNYKITKRSLKGDENRMDIKQILPANIPLEKVFELHTNIQAVLPNYKVKTDFIIK
jgi:hypothetical protein